MQDNKYCVYLHRRKDTNQIFYVGQGTSKRPYVATRKLKAWNDLVSKSGGFIVEIIADSLSKEQAVEIELVKIEEYKDLIVNLQTSSSKTKELDYNTFNQKFYVDETSPSGLRFKIDVYAGKNYRSLINSKDSVAGILSPDGSWSITHEKKPVKVHRVIYLLVNKSIDSSKIIDHINGNPSDNSLNNLRQVCSKVNRRNLKIDKRNSTGVTGVSLTVKNTYRASVLDESGLRLEKSFSISKYGKDKAFHLACQWRKERIEELNAQGAGYTARHGT
jgi:hypothetical protein